MGTTMSISRVGMLNDTRHYLIIFFLWLLIFNNIYSQSSTNYISKKGGICFRTDDNQLISRYLEYAALFNKYNQKFCFAINLGRDEITPDYIAGLKQIQASGHEIMDHTPWHRTNYFFTNLSTDYYQNNPGVYRINGTSIELDYKDVDITKAKRSGYVNINGDIVTSHKRNIFQLFQIRLLFIFPGIKPIGFYR